MPGAGEYTLSNIGFSREEIPFLSLQKNGVFSDLLPSGKTITLAFDTSQRFCIGWRDIATGGQFSCPESTVLGTKYEQCPACQKRTGFNPAFYRATSVSVQQEKRNGEPHFLYLAHFGPGILKVGISYAARSNSRLLEQGARSALILETFPTAHIARQYEAEIAVLPGVTETVQLRKKLTALTQSYDQDTARNELIHLRLAAEKSLGVAFAKNHVLSLDKIFFPEKMPVLSEAYDCSSQDLISGKVTGMLGSVLFCQQQDVPVFLPLKKYVGYRLVLSYEEIEIKLPARQVSLF